MKKRIFLSIFGVACLTVLIAVSAVIFADYNILAAERESALKNEMQYIRAGISEKGAEYLHIFDRVQNKRVMLIAPDGAVLYDNIARIQTMRNHLERLEIAQCNTARVKVYAPPKPFPKIHIIMRFCWKTVVYCVFPHRWKICEACFIIPSGFC